MKKLPVSVTISAAIHVAAVVWVGAREPTVRDDAAAPAITTIEVVEATPPPSEPIAVRIASEAELARLEAAVAPPPRTAATTRRRATRLAASVGVAAVEVGRGGDPGTGPTTTTEPGSSRSKYFDMRRGDRPDLTLGKGRFDDLDHAPRGTGPARGVPASGQLESAAGGRRKSNQDVFVARVDRDGTVDIVDSRNLSAELSWNPAKFLSGRFDVTDWLMRSSKNDPYASRKLKFLDETRDERAELGAKWKQQQLQGTAILMRKNLERAWASSAGMAARKRALFELWDEIVEPERSDDAADELLVEASRAARRAVIGFIRARLPAGSEHAYTETELVAMNGSRQSQARFSPYE